MKIRTQLVALVSGVVLPLVLLAVFLTVELWHQQRQTYQQQFLERANAVHLTLDTQLDSTLRTLRAAGDAAEIPEAEAEVVLRRRFRRLLDNYPEWAAVALTDAQGHVTMTNRRPGKQAVPLLAAADIERTMSSTTGFISDVLTTPDGQHIVFVGAAIMHDGRTQGVIYAAIDHAHWLTLLRTYRVSQRGTLTLMDRSGTVIARTLNDPQWAGKKAPSAYWAQTVDRPGGAFKTVGLDGVPFYAAFSRSGISGWMLATGVPQDEVDDALYGPTLIVLLVAAAAIFGAIVAAWRLGKSITGALLGLEGTASALVEQTPLPELSLPITEARAVRRALVDAHGQLLEREASLSASLEREAAARAQAESGNRAKDQFLAMMGHELRNPLSAITAAIELLGTGAVPREVSERSREVARRQAGHLAGMINDLMDVAQLDSGAIVLRKTILDLARVASKVQLRFEETGRSAHLRMHAEHVPAWIEADESRVELIMTCLLDNACKYTPAGGTITVLVRGEADRSILRITDSGVGIATDVASTMFDAFTQSTRSIERAQGGLGLGLALARRLVDLHEGVMTATSDGPGRGATFTVTFPKADAPLPAEPPSPAAAGLVLTIVEDIDDTRDMMVLLMEAPGRRINAAADGPSGVALILQGPSDVAVVDIGLPGFDGMEVARRVREAPGGERVVLIALTGYGTEQDRSRALQAGFDDFLVKPFNHEQLEKAVAAGLAARRVAAAQTVR